MLGVSLMTHNLTYRDIERQIVEILPELRPAAEYYWQVKGEPGSDPGPYILFEDMFGAYVTILLAMPNSPRRDELLRRAFGLAETMLMDGDEDVHALAFIGLLESQGAWWWRRAQPFMGPAAQHELDEREPWWRTEIDPSTPDDAQFIDLYGVRCIMRVNSRPTVSLLIVFPAPRTNKRLTDRLQRPAGLRCAAFCAHAAAAEPGR
jgi:hypothetical protein